MGLTAHPNVFGRFDFLEQDHAPNRASWKDSRSETTAVVVWRCSAEEEEDDGSRIVVEE